jgi:hypothetical protein
MEKAEEMRIEMLRVFVTEIILEKFTHAILEENLWK